MNKKICQFKAADIDEGSLCDHTIYYTPPRIAYKHAYKHWRSSHYAMIPCNELASVVKEDAYRSWKKRNTILTGWSSMKKWSEFHKLKYRLLHGGREDKSD